LPNQSVQEISAIRDKIVAILNNHRNKQEQSLNAGEEQDLSVTTFDKLEIYSRDAKAVLDESNSRSER
jgi:hypothetical protein